MLKADSAPLQTGRQRVCLQLLRMHLKKRRKLEGNELGGGGCEGKEVCVGGGCFVDRCVGLWHEKS